MTSTNRVVANALMSLEELLKKQGLSRAEFDKMMKEMKDKGASAVHYMRGKDGRLLFKADGTTIGNAISEKAVNGEEVENTRTLPVSKQAWTECELKGIEAMKKYLASHKGVLPRTIKEVDDVLGIIPDIDVAEKQNVMSYFKYGRGKSLVANSMKDDVAKIAKMVGRSLTPNEERSARILLEAGEPASRIARSIQATATNAATNAKFKVGDVVRLRTDGGKHKYKVVKVLPDADAESIMGGYLVQKMPPYDPSAHGLDKNIGSARSADMTLANSSACNAAGYVDASSVVLHPGDAVVFKAQYSSHKDDDEWLERNGDTVREVRGNEVKLGPSANDWAKKSDLMVWHNAMACNADFKVGDKVTVKGDGDRVHEVTYVYRDGSVQLDNSGTAAFKPMFLTLANAARACNSTNAIVRKAMNAAALNFSPGDKVSIVDTDIRYGGDKGEVVRKDGFRYVVRLTSRLDKPEVLLQPNQLKAANAEDAQKSKNAIVEKAINAVAKNADEYVIRKAFTPGKWFLERKAKSLGDAGSIKVFSSEDEARSYAKSKGLSVVNAVVENAVTDWERSYTIKGLPVKLAYRGSPYNDIKATVEGGNRDWIEVARVSMSNPPSQAEAEKMVAPKWSRIKRTAPNAVAKNAAWSAERIEPGNEKGLLSFHAEAFAKNPTQDRFERLARIVEGEASKGLLAKYYAPGNATSELMAAIREGREQVIGGKGSEVAKKIAGIVEGLRRIGTNSTNPVVANAMRETLNWSAFGGADGQVVTMPIPKSEYGKSDLDFLVEWARKNSADLAKYYTPSNVASKVIALAEKAKRKIDDTTKRRQSEADAKFGTGIGRVNVPDVPLKKTEPEIAEIRSVLAGIKQIPSASKEAQKRDAAMERRQKAETQRYYDTHPYARD